ncbi:MAG TPA: 3'-5' exonuclease [Candidatus Thermoplasmatota archaeon]|nr:3'-5' exonuclease [Candidatus Thermoplasmatota archaeon]
MHIVAIDTETCALGPGRDRLVQFCAMELDGDLNQLSVWTELVNPGCHIPSAATAIHGISDDMVRDAPRFGFFAPRLRALIRPDTVFMAYNAGFDLGILDLEFTRCGVEPIPAHQPVLDPLQLERRLTSRSLGPTYRRYTGKDLENAHTADADVMAMVEVLRHQREVHADILPPRTEDLVGWPSQAPRIRRKGHLYKDESGTVRLGFGKHNGKPAAEVPEYLAWMLEEEFPERAKRAARRILQEQTLPLRVAGILEERTLVA